MGIGEELAPATGMFSGGFSRLLSHAWILIPVIVIFGGIAIVWWIKQIRAKKEQWTHTLRVRRVLGESINIDGKVVYRLSDPIIHRMRRFPLIKKAEVFELEKSLLGGYLLPELDEYSGHNEFSIILDKNNRIYTNKGEFFNPDKSSVMVSAKHSEIDVQRQNLKANFQNINKINKRLEWSTIAKYAFMIVGIIALTIVTIVGIQNWAESKDADAQAARGQAEAMNNLADAMKTIEGVVNTQQIIINDLKQMHGTNNLQSLIKINSS